MKKNHMTTLILVITASLTALIAGLFYAYSCSVSPGLGQLSDKEYINAMNAINRAILNPVFFASFMGTLIILPISTFISYTPVINTRFILLFTATVIYAIGVFGVTAFGNVPLNNALANFNTTTASVKEMADHRKMFEGPWNFLQNIRATANIVTLILVIVSLLFEKK